MELIKQRVKSFILYLSKLGKLVVLACPVPKRSFWFGALLFFVILGSLIPLYHAHALFGILGGVADAIGKAIGWIIASYMLIIPTAILGIASILLGWSIDPWFIKVPYTSGGVVDVGWPVVRDLANMFIVLILVIIGLATALRLEEYRAKKTLPLLIGVALLINFTPVILGVIIDFTNIVMNFFLEGLTGGQIIGGVFTNISHMIASDLGGFNFFNPVELISFIIKIQIIGIFMVFAAVVFFLFAILFMMRRVAIWILVILSPIAFVAYILPATRGFFRYWWSQFINWAIIGVFAAFFLWLGDHMIGLAASGGLTGAVGDPNPVAAILNDVLPYGIALIFLLVGFFAALSTSAMGASGVIGGAQKFGKWAPKAVGAAGASTARGIPAVAEREARVRRRLERTPIIGAMVGGEGAFDAEMTRDRKRVGKNLEDMNVENLQRIAHKSPVTRDDRLRRARAVELLAERNRLEPEMMPDGTVFNPQNYFQEASQYGVSSRTLRSKVPSAAPAADIREIVERQETREFRRNVQPQAFETVTIDPNTGARHRQYTDANLEVFYSMDVAKIQELGRTGSRQQKEALRNLTDQREQDVTDMITSLRLTNTDQSNREAEKIEWMWIHAQGSPNYQT